MIDAPELLQAARDDLARGFIVRAGTRLRQAAQAGSRVALHELCAALLGRRVPGGPEEARRWLERAGDGLDPYAFFLRAGLRYAGMGGEISSPKALEDLAAAAAGGLAEARIETAMLWQEHGSEHLRTAQRYWLEAASSRAPLGYELLDAPEDNGVPQPPPVRSFAATATFAGELLHSEPRIERFASVLNPIECGWLKARARPFLAPSRIIDPQTGNAKANPVRTSEAMCFDPARPGIFARRIAARLAGLAGLDFACAEPLAVLRYSPGQEYKPHHDGLGKQALGRDPLRAAGDRVATVLAWLNEPEAGGATLFPRLDLRVAPRAGQALVFFNLDPGGNPSPLAFHAGEPVAKGEKWLASLWIRERPIPS